jgi:hypothetical protein
MKYLIPVLVGGATITVALTTALAQAHGALSGNASMTPYLCGYGVAAIFLVIASILAVNAHKEEKPTTKEVPPAKAEDVRLEHLLAVVEDKTEVQAHSYVKRWLGKRVRLNAQIWDVGRADGDAFMVSLMGENGVSTCYFFAPRTELEDFAHLRRGTTITIEGTINTLAASNIQLEKVQLIEVEDQKDQPVQAATARKPETPSTEEKNAAYEANVEAMIREIRKIKNSAANRELPITAAPNDDLEVFNEAMRRIRNEEEQHKRLPQRLGG